MRCLSDAEWDVLLLDLKLPDANGVDLLAKVRKSHEELQTIIVTGFANVESAIDTMRLGAFDYLTKPPNFEELAVRVEKAGSKTFLERENRRLRYQVQRSLGSDIVTRSGAFKKVLRTLEKVAPAATPVLIQGESGVGKELVAQRLHRISPRSNKAFVDLNCAAVPDQLLESELFGHERGAFTGAGAEKPGLVEIADGGRCSSTRSVRWPRSCSRSSCGCSTAAPSTGWEPPASGAPTSGWSRPPTATCRPRSRPAASARTSSTGSTECA